MNDLIKREAVINMLDEICKKECVYGKQPRHLMCSGCHLESAFYAIEQLPAEQPECKTGKGVEHDAAFNRS